MDGDCYHATVDAVHGSPGGSPGTWILNTNTAQHDDDDESDDDDDSDDDNNDSDDDSDDSDGLHRCT